MRVWAILILVVLGAVARLASLGDAPLDPGEAAQAAAAWSTIERDGFDPARLSPQPESAFLAGISSLLFFVFDGGGDLIARLPSALCGIALVLLALRLGRDPGALALAALVAVDPWLVAASRRGSGAIFAAATAIVGWLLLRRIALAGSSAAVEPTLRRLWLGVGATIGVLAVAGAAAWDFLPPFIIAVLALRAGGEFTAVPRPPAAAMGAAAIGAALIGASGGLLRWGGLPLVTASVESWLRSWSAGFARSSFRSLLDVSPAVAFHLVLLVALAAWWMARAGSGSSGPGDRSVLGLWIGWGVAMQMRGGAHPDTWLALEVPLILAASLALERIFAGEAAAAELSTVASRRRRVALVALALTGVSALAAGVTGVPRPRAALPGARLLAGDLSTLLAVPAADRPKIELETGPQIDAVLAWYLREVPLEPVAAAGSVEVDDSPRIVIARSSRPLAEERAANEGPGYGITVAEDRVDFVTLR